jgi:hypothetical protein
VAAGSSLWGEARPSRQGSSPGPRATATPAEKTSSTRKPSATRL